MRYPPSILDEIRARLPMSVVVGKRVALKKEGREFRGLSPFNKEKTPSFYVNDQKGFYHCFSSSKHGDQFGFVMETEGLTFPEAVERLAAEAGVPLPKMSEEAEVVEKKRKGLGEALELAATFFEQQLQERVGAGAREYLRSRDLPVAVQREFRLGYAPGERFALRDHLAAKGVSAEVMIEAGMLVHGEDIAVPYDRFRDRVMFPICDAKGRVIAFGGRALQKDVAAKYLNSPETPLFHKGATLYNLHRARKAAHDKNMLIAVEGYVDVIAMTRAGFPQAVAPLGTALTEDQLTLMWRMVPEPILCFDGDKAGQRAAQRAIDVALPSLAPGKTLRFAFLPAGQDPDDLLRSSGAEAVAAVVNQPRAFIDVLFSREAEREATDTPERRADLEKRLRDLVSGIKDEVVRKHYREAVDERLKSLFQSRRSASGRGGAQGQGTARGGRAGTRGRFGPPPVPTPKSHALVSEQLKRSALFSGAASISPREAALVIAAIHQPIIIDRQAETLAALELASRELSRLKQAVLDLAGEGLHREADEVPLLLASQGLAEILLRAEAALNPADLKWTQAEADSSYALEAWNEAVLLHINQASLHKELGVAGDKVALEGDEQAFEQLRGLVARREVF